jgi:hypothetical protein
MAYEEAKPLPGLPPPSEPRETPLVADGSGQSGLSGRLGRGTAAALQRIEEQFRQAAAPTVQAALGEAEAPEL